MRTKRNAARGFSTAMRKKRALKPAMLRLYSYAYKTQFRNMNKPNADMTANGGHFGLVCAGVGGIEIRPEDLSEDLRNCLRVNLGLRFNGQDTKTFDGKVVDMIGGDVRETHRDPPAAWLARLFHLSLCQTKNFGATTLGMASVIGQKLSYLNIGDVLIQVFRWDSALKCVMASAVLQVRTGFAHRN
jgi:hypothetical protein